MSPKRKQGFLGLLTFLACASGSIGAAEPVLHLLNDGYVPGALRASPDPAVLRWHSPSFTQPLEFPLGTVKAVHYPIAGPPPKPVGEYCFELLDDDVLYGDLLAITENEVEVNSALAGRLQLRRENIRRLYRWKGADTLYDGPNGLAGWSEATATSTRWTDHGGRLVTDQIGASIFGETGIPEKAAIEVELSWKKKADFTLTLGVDDRDRTGKQGFRFEVWDGDLVVVGESARYADVALVQPVGAGEGRIRVQVFLDQAERSLILLSRGGKPLATLSLDEGKPPFRTGVRLTNGKGDIQLDHFRVSRWTGVAPRDVRDDQSRLHRTDGSIVYGRLAAYNPETKQFTMRDGTTETVVAHDSVTDVYVSPSRAAGNPKPEPNSMVRVAYRDGSRLSGRPTRIEDNHLTLAGSGAKEAVRLPLTGVRSIVSLNRSSDAAASSVAGRPGRLEMEGLILKGRLVANGESLAWHADLARQPSALPQGFTGRIVYRDPPPPPPPPAPRPTAMRAPQAIGFGQAVAEALISGRDAPPVPSAGKPALHLRTGDTIPCEVTSMDDKGVSIKTPLTDATFVSHEKIKCVELIGSRNAPGLDIIKRDRLLTLPRMRRDSPPTHLICSKNGDFLRGRIVEMDEARLKVEVRLETKEIPRDRVAQIIWLHPDELADQKTSPAVAGDAKHTRAQALHADGNRLTFIVSKSDGATISGTSDVLGACRAELDKVDQLLFGASIEQSAAKLAYHVWRLHHATDPKFVQADATGSGDGASTGVESPLVGQAAPAFQLDMLDGSKFRLADRKGRVVVLDFWATWCGPCLQYMPLVDGVAREFADKGVELLAVNMEEQPDQIKAMLERHKLKMPVALDRDGVVAAKYVVSAIPQTVVIDREGKVARLFVGGGKTTAEALRKALEELSAAKPSPAPSP